MIYFLIVSISLLTTSSCSSMLKFKDNMHGKLQIANHMRNNNYKSSFESVELTRRSIYLIFIKPLEREYVTQNSTLNYSVTPTGKKAVINFLKTTRNSQ